MILIHSVWHFYVIKLHKMILSGKYMHLCTCWCSRLFHSGIEKANICVLHLAATGSLMSTSNRQGTVVCLLQHNQQLLSMGTKVVASVVKLTTAYIFIRDSE